MRKDVSTSEEPRMGQESPDSRFSEQDAALILRQAALLDQGALAPRSASGYTLQELQEIAAEAGIEPRYVAAAAAQLPVRTDSWAPVVGGATRFRAAHEVPGEIGGAAWEQVVDRVRETLRTAGRTLMLPGKLDWRSNDQPEPPFHVRVESGAGTTRIRVDADVRGPALVSVGLPGLYGALIAALLGDTQLGLAGAGLIGAIAGGAVAGAAAGRMLWRYASHRFRRKVGLLVGRLAELPVQAEPGPTRLADDTAHPPGGSAG
ncbi:MAG: hypothetical protein KY467_00205 [Gemmatimonadetes bacterium]|nr:hypothetical protein [Gemmatimonadota bacterium]